jgi:hypothetical protein
VVTRNLPSTEAVIVSEAEVIHTPPTEWLGTDEPASSETISAIRPVETYSSLRLPHIAVMACPSWLPDLPGPYKLLLDYFVHVTVSFSCHEAVKDDFFRTFVPMAVDTSHVMASILNLAAVHRVKAGLTQCTKQLALLQVVTVEQLRSSLLSSSGIPTEASMATVLMLCYSAIVAGGERARSWRLHLEGAASLLGCDVSLWNIDSESTSRAFIARCFVSLVALANCSRWPPTLSVTQRALNMLGAKGQTSYIDEFTAYSPDLVYIFSEIGALLRERQDISYRPSPDLEQRAEKLVQQLETMISAGQVDFMKMDGVGSLSAAHKQEFVNINQAYHHAAILQIHQRLRGIHPSSADIQNIVQRILDLLSRVRLLNGPCPGTVILFPVFSAGCGAITASQREQVRNVLHSMMERYRITNVQQCMDTLEALWSDRDKHGESEGNISWESFTGK